MQLLSQLLLAAGFVAVSAPIQAPIAPEPASTALPTATVRFTNNLTGNASLSAGSKVLFSDVTPSKTTEWATVSDSSVTFTVKEAGEGKQPATATQTIEDGAKYTIVASPGMNGHPELSIKKESKPTPPDSTSGQE